MLNAERKAEIVKIVEREGSASVQELMAILESSESTIRRDLTELHKKGLIQKVHGGAVAVKNLFLTEDASVAERQDLNAPLKQMIGKFAATLIQDEDVVYIDAGTTTACMIDYIQAKNATFFTNSVNHAKRLLSNGFQVFMPGGMLKEKTEALIGSDTCFYLSKINFTIGFFGSNGITEAEGFTTPDRREAAVKEVAFNKSRNRYVLCDHSKFDSISAATFALYDDAFIITDDKVPEKYKEIGNILIAE